MPQKGEKFVDAQGREWRGTEGGNWRLYQNGKPTSTVSKGSAPPGGGAAAAPGALPADQRQTIENNTPAKLSPEGAQWLNLASQSLQQQVAQGLIPQATADQQMRANQAEVSSLSPELQKRKLDLQGQVMQGLINQSQADNQMFSLKTQENSTSPVTNTNLSPDSTTSDVINNTFDVSKAATGAGNTLTNPNQYNPFGSSVVTIDPVTGQPTVTQSFTGANQRALEGIQGTGISASQVAQGLLGDKFDQFVQGAGPQSGYSDPALEQAVYSRLTRGYDQDYEQQLEAKKQELANRGIGVGNQAYSNEMNRFDRMWDEKRLQARESATLQGTNAALQRQQNNVGALGTLSGGLGTLGGLGQSGFYQPNFQGFNSVQYQQPDVQGLYGTQYAGQLTREGYQNELERQRIAAGATTEAASIAAEASKANAATAANASKPGAFATKPPGS